MRRYAKRFYLKKRNNLQSGIYYVAMGPMSAARAKKAEKSLAGFNEMIPFDTEAEYEAEIERLRKSGERFID